MAQPVSLRRVTRRHAASTPAAATAAYLFSAAIDLAGTGPANCSDPNDTGVSHRQGTGDFVSAQLCHRALTISSASNVPLPRGLSNTICQSCGLPLPRTHGCNFKVSPLTRAQARRQRRALAKDKQGSKRRNTRVLQRICPLCGHRNLSLFYNDSAAFQAVGQESPHTRAVAGSASVSSTVAVNSIRTVSEPSSEAGPPASEAPTPHTASATTSSVPRTEENDMQVLTPPEERTMEAEEQTKLGLALVSQPQHPLSPQPGLPEDDLAGESQLRMGHVGVAGPRPTEPTQGTGPPVDISAAPPRGEPRDVPTDVCESQKEGTPGGACRVLEEHEVLPAASADGPVHASTCPMDVVAPQQTAEERAPPVAGQCDAPPSGGTKTTADRLSPSVETSPSSHDMPGDSQTASGAGCPSDVAGQIADGEPPLPASQEGSMHPPALPHFQPAREYASLKVVELKQMLRTRNLPVSGLKAVLVKRLEDADGALVGTVVLPRHGAGGRGQDVTPEECQAQQSSGPERQSGSPEELRAEETETIAELPGAAQPQASTDTGQRQPLAETDKPDSTSPIDAITTPQSDTASPAIRLPSPNNPEQETCQPGSTLDAFETDQVQPPAVLSATGAARAAARECNAQAAGTDGLRPGASAGPEDPQPHTADDGSLLTAPSSTVASSQLRCETAKMGGDATTHESVKSPQIHSPVNPTSETNTGVSVAHVGDGDQGAIAAGQKVELCLQEDARRSSLPEGSPLSVTHNMETTPHGDSAQGLSAVGPLSQILATGALEQHSSVDKEEIEQETACGQQTQALLSSPPASGGTVQSSKYGKAGLLLESGGNRSAHAVPADDTQEACEQPAGHGGGGDFTAASAGDGASASALSPDLAAPRPLPAAAAADQPASLSRSSARKRDRASASSVRPNAEEQLQCQAWEECVSVCVPPSSQVIWNSCGGGWHRVGRAWRPPKPHLRRLPPRGTPQPPGGSPTVPATHGLPNADCRTSSLAKAHSGSLSSHGTLSSGSACPSLNVPVPDTAPVSPLNGSAELPSISAEEGEGCLVSAGKVGECLLPSRPAGRLRRRRKRMRLWRESVRAQSLVAAASCVTSSHRRQHLLCQLWGPTFL